MLLVCGEKQGDKICIFDIVSVKEIRVPRNAEFLIKRDLNILKRQFGAIRSY